MYFGAAAKTLALQKICSKNLGWNNIWGASSNLHFFLYTLSFHHHSLLEFHKKQIVGLVRTPGRCPQPPKAKKESWTGLSISTDIFAYKHTYRKKLRFVIIFRYQTADQHDVEADIIVTFNILAASQASALQSYARNYQRMCYGETTFYQKKLSCRAHCWKYRWLISETLPKSSLRKICSGILKTPKVMRACKDLIQIHHCLISVITEIILIPNVCSCSMKRGCP